MYNIAFKYLPLSEKLLVRPVNYKTLPCLLLPKANAFRVMYENNVKMQFLLASGNSFFISHWRLACKCARSQHGNFRGEKERRKNATRKENQQRANVEQWQFFKCKKLRITSALYEFHVCWSNAGEVAEVIIS